MSQAVYRVDGRRAMMHEGQVIDEKDVLQEASGKMTPQSRGPVCVSQLIY